MSFYQKLSKIGRAIERFCTGPSNRIYDGNTIYGIMPHSSLSTAGVLPLQDNADGRRGRLRFAEQRPYLSGDQQDIYALRELDNVIGSALASGSPARLARIEGHISDLSDIFSRVSAADARQQPVPVLEYKLPASDTRWAIPLRRAEP